MSFIKFDNIGKKYENNTNYSVEGFNLDVEQGEFIAFVGPSGCGKTTTLRMIAGLEEISAGTIDIDGRIVNDVAPKDRDIAMVFQNYALYPHMTVGENITCGLKARKAEKEVITEKLTWASEILGLENYLDKKPKDLSGGQKQRVALGRAMVRNPKVFLMDEPLSNLDAKLRAVMRTEITKLHRQLGSTTIYVTHDQVEAMTMADRIVIMKDGDIQQIGTPKEVYNNPVNKFVGGFIGAPQMNFIDVEVDGSTINIAGQEISFANTEVEKKGLPSKVTMGIRPEFLYYQSVAIDAYQNTVFNALIDNVEELGNEMIVHFMLGNQKFIAKVDSNFNKKIGDEVTFAINISKVHFFDIETEMKI